MQIIMKLIIICVVFFVSANALDTVEQRLATVENNVAQLTAKADEILVYLRKASTGIERTGPLKNDTDLEERVTVLEFQMTEVTEDLTEAEDGLSNVEGQITVIFADQTIQDEGHLELETDTETDSLHSSSLIKQV